ncbi:diguanylate cyclase domain-containing protein [Lysinibacillus antri]|uniref:Diguanylate cyclase n=1 Tax=Lysinibacillus antri TaxID=2498145 RepID=A0A432L8I7_9BACI|nr:diguanylate cyclase [Lysinibacillus antri]RUL48681.1 diguanylate cyclase [Lysinibacillus antri]
MKLNSLGKLGNKLLNSIFISALLIIVIVITFTIFIRVSLDVNIKGQRSLDDLEVLTNQLYQALIDQETGQRGYSLTKDESFLEPYYIGGQQFHESSDELIQLSTHFPTLHKQAKLLVAEGQDWHNLYGDPFVALAEKGELPNLLVSVEAKHLIDEFRVTYKEFTVMIDAERTIVRNTMKTRINSTLFGLVFFIIFIILINLLVNFRILKSVIKPIIKLSNNVKSYTEHDFTKVVPTYNKQDELYDLIQNVDIMRTELSSSIQTLEEKVNFDGLTGLYNRRYFNETMLKEWAIAKEKHFPISIILFDIDFYKNFNDTYGHLAGDECLKTIATCLKNFNDEPVRFVARFGGEEFVVFLQGQDEHQAMQLAEEIRKAVENLKIPHSKSEVHDYVTISMGVATVIPTDYIKSTKIFNMADQAMYESKNNGRNRVTKYEKVVSYQ